MRRLHAQEGLALGVMLTGFLSMLVLLPVLAVLVLAEGLCGPPGASR